MSETEPRDFVEEVKASIDERIEEMRPEVEKITTEFERLCAARDALSGPTTAAKPAPKRRGRPPGSRNK